MLLSAFFTECHYDGQIRLSGGNDTSGRVEVCYSSEWGTVCDNYWDDFAAEVVCRQLGLPFFGEQHTATKKNTIHSIGHAGIIIIVCITF